MDIQQPNIQIMALPGGKLPERKTAGANGYDVYTRAIVDPHAMDPNFPYMRKTLFDFKTEPDPSLKDFICETAEGLAYQLLPGKSVLIGGGFITAIPPDYCYTVMTRSKYYLKPEPLAVIPTLVDSDYRGEPAIRVLNISSESFPIIYHLRIAQIVFHHSYFPNFEMVDDYAAFPKTARGTKGGGSTGLT